MGNGRGVTNLLVSGSPGVGKTTALRAVARTLGERCGGFYTEEIREGRERVGFRTVTLDGAEGPLAHVRRPGPPRVGRYGVDVEGFEGVALPALQRALRERDLILVDEIGKMEILSARFRGLIEEALDSPKPVVASIARGHEGWLGALKARSDVSLRTLTRESRGAFPAEVLLWFRSLLPPFAPSAA